MAAPTPPRTFTMTDIPAMFPPPPITSNFIDPPSLHPAVLVVATTTMTAMLLVVTIRLFTKAYLMREMKIEEYFCLLATMGILMWDSIYIHVSLHGFSRHLWDVRLVDVTHFAYMSYLAEISYALTMFAAKSSILFQLKTLFCPDSPTHRRLFTAVAGRRGVARGGTGPVFWALHGLMFVNGAYYLSAFLSFLLQCSPREKAWDIAVREGRCINVAAATVVSGVVNLVLDLGILVVPIWAIWRLRLSVKRRLGISAVFGVGVVTCVIAAMGVAVRVPLLWDKDLTWLITKVGIWTMVEYFGTILVGCMPSFPRFFLFLRGQEPSTQAALTAASGPASKGSSGRRSMRPSIQDPAPALKPSTAPSVVHYSNSSMVPSKPKGSSIITSYTVRKSCCSTLSGSPIGVALSTSEVSFTRASSDRSVDGGFDYIELEEGRYSRDDGGHVGYASSLSGVVSVCSDGEDGEAIVEIRNNGDYDDAEEYWSRPPSRLPL